MKIIVAVDCEWGIGNKGDLLIKIPQDMKFFREKTLGKIIVMGRKTLGGFPGGKPLKGRVNIVLSSSIQPQDGITVCKSKEDLFKILREYDTDDVYIIGGGTVYREFLPYCDTAYVTKICRNFEKDTYFPNLDKESGWEMTDESDPYEWEGTEFSFTVYKNRNPQKNS